MPSGKWQQCVSCSDGSLTHGTSSSPLTVGIDLSQVVVRGMFTHIHWLKPQVTGLPQSAQDFSTSHWNSSVPSELEWLVYPPSRAAMTKYHRLGSENTEICCLTSLEAGSLRSGCWQVWFLLQLSPRLIKGHSPPVSPRNLPGFKAHPCWFSVCANFLFRIPSELD